MAWPASCSLGAQEVAEWLDLGGFGAWLSGFGLLGFGFSAYHGWRVDLALTMILLGFAWIWVHFGLLWLITVHYGLA